MCHSSNCVKFPHQLSFLQSQNVIHFITLRHSYRHNQPQIFRKNKSFLTRRNGETHSWNIYDYTVIALTNLTDVNKLIIRVIENVLKRNRHCWRKYRSAKEICSIGKKRGTRLDLLFGILNRPIKETRTKRRKYRVQ